MSETHHELVKRVFSEHLPPLYNIIDLVYLRLMEGTEDMADDEVYDKHAEKMWGAAEGLVGDYLLNNAGRDWHAQYYGYGQDEEEEPADV